MVIDNRERQTRGFAPTFIGDTEKSKFRFGAECLVELIEVLSCLDLAGIPDTNNNHVATIVVEGVRIAGRIRGEEIRRVWSRSGRDKRWRIGFLIGIWSRLCAFHLLRGLRC